MLGAFNKMAEHEALDAPSHMVIPTQQYSDPFVKNPEQEAPAPQENVISHIGISTKIYVPHLPKSPPSPPTECHVIPILRKFPNPSFSLGWERENTRTCPAFRLFRGISKGFVSILPEAKCCIGMGCRLGAMV